MRHELNLVSSSVTPDPKASPQPSRLDLRVATDRLVTESFDLPGLVEKSCSVMLVAAAILARFELNPQVSDFAEAVQASIENGRAVMDKGLLLQSKETINCGAVMLELTVRGACAAMSVPYDLVLQEVHRAQCAIEDPQVRRILTEIGLISAPAASNDEPPLMHHPV